MIRVLRGYLGVLVLPWILTACSGRNESVSEAPPEPEASTPSTWDHPVAPDTPAGRRLASIVSFLSEWDGNAEAGEAFVRATLAPKFFEEFPMEAHVGFLDGMRESLPGAQLRQVADSSETEIRGYLYSEETDSWVQFDLAVSAVAPHLATTIFARPSLKPLSPETLTVLDGELTREAKSAAIEVIAGMMDEVYVKPEEGRKAVAALREALEAGKYDDATDRESFARLLTEDLTRTAGDRHLRVSAFPRPEPKAAESDPHRPPPDGKQVGPDGIAEVKMLEGEVGYLDLRFFAPPEQAKEGIDAAMKQLEGAKALVFDMRRNGGGDPRGVQYLCSYLFADKVHLNSLYWREGDRTEEFWTLEEVGGAKRVDTPVFVLTSKYTFSGAEEFSYNLQTRKRATLVGETTGGGANPGGVLPIGSHLQIFVPRGMAINPVTGTNWEGTGVEPEVQVAWDKALDKALKLARGKKR